MTSRASWRLIAPLGALLFAACGSPTEPDDAVVERNRVRFRTTVGDSYSCRYQNIAFSAPPIIDPVRMTVRGGRVATLVNLNTGEPIPEAFRELFLTVDQIFDVIARAERDGAAAIRVRYDPDLGYPTDTFIDFDSRIADEERGFTIRELVRE